MKTNVTTQNANAVNIHKANDTQALTHQIHKTLQAVAYEETPLQSYVAKFLCSEPIYMWGQYLQHLHGYS